jgi:predicted nucleic acid-binding protein
MAKSLLLVDTNIISHALTSNQTAAYTALFKELETSYKFVVTGYTQYELMCSSDKENRAKIADFIEQEMVCIELSNVLMQFAARVCYLYSKHRSTVHHKIGTGDIINAATAIIQNCAIITIDNNDHPTPFFREVDRKRITYQSKKDKETTDVAYILMPDMEHLRQCFSEHKV